MNVLTNVFTMVSGVTSIIGLIVLIVKPIREKLFGLGKIKKGIQCELRKDILDIYYANYEKKTLTYFERKTLDSMYEAYVELNGNSFIHNVYKEMCEWHVIQA